MKLNLDSTTLEWQQKARRFAEQELIPCEIEAEMNGGACRRRSASDTRKWRLNSGSARWMFRAKWAA